MEQQTEFRLVPEMCQFTRTPMAGLHVSFMLVVFPRCPLEDKGIRFICLWHDPVHTKDAIWVSNLENLGAVANSGK